MWQPQLSIYQFSKICLAECPFYHSSLKFVLQSFYFPPELLSNSSRELACKNREFSHCFDERCCITTQQDYCSLFSFISVAPTDLLCIASTVAFFRLNFIHCCGYFLSGTSDRCWVKGRHGCHWEGLPNSLPLSLISSTLSDRSAEHSDDLFPD